MMPALLNGNNSMARRLKLLTGLSSIAFTGALTLSACGEEKKGEAAATEPDHAAHQSAIAAPASEEEIAAAAQTGGEAEAASAVDLATDKAAYLSALQIVRGHLRAGGELYAAGDRELGPQHLRHPQAEMLTSLAPALASHGATAIDPAIDALASAGEEGASPARIAELQSAALAAIASASEAASPSLKDRLLAAAKTLTVAGDEYSIAVKDGVIVNLHEYHDAYGFIATVIGDLKALKGSSDAEEQAIRTALDQAMIAATAAPTVVPPLEGLKPASVIYGAAARAEIAARSL